MGTEHEDWASARKMPEWERYERLVARLVADQLSTVYCVTLNAKVQGKISERSRQIDVLIDARHDTDNRQRIIIDAKARARQIDVTHVEAFRGLMEDVEATHGYLVCPHGYTPAAERRAQEAVSIRLLPLDRLENFDPSTWPRCLTASCRNGRVFWDGYPAFDVMLAPAQAPTSAPRRATFVHYVGKCDRCGRFHVKCTTCGDMFSPTYESDEDCGVTCSCRLPWFWLASIESDMNGTRSVELHLIAGADRIWTVDRRSL
ncbi:restriction endonuclease [Aquabacterium sp. J223]|uniref:restriction endonuclease n=1 Tax=Aquabacterium sp. J223 TaxID=2898431 RepID=UPI0021ADC8BE|nr:restriction endonuclease [Aquabacterium sp. J223]UUX96602.1 restriction endonuclease [Aquabacterium sp. J223]